MYVVMLKFGNTLSKFNILSGILGESFYGFFS